MLKISIKTMFKLDEFHKKFSGFKLILYFVLIDISIFNRDQVSVNVCFIGHWSDKCVRWGFPIGSNFSGHYLVLWTSVRPFWVFPNLCPAFLLSDHLSVQILVFPHHIRPLEVFWTASGFFSFPVKKGVLRTAFW